MLASEYIQKLEAMIQQYGDIEIAVFGDLKLMIVQSIEDIPMVVPDGRKLGTSGLSVRVGNVIRWYLLGHGAKDGPEIENFDLARLSKIPMKELRKMRNFGCKSTHELINYMNGFGVELKW